MNDKIQNNKILIVEDDLGIAKSLQLYLENSGFDVDVHPTWKWAVDMIIDSDYDVIILDVNLPVMDGIDICKKVRKTSSVPIIMLTARTSELDKITGLEIWADDYVPKPFSPRELLARVKSIIRRISSAKEEQWEELDIIEIENVKICKEKRIVEIAWEEISLTKNEYDILLRIFEEWGKVVSREVLMTEVIWYDNYVYDRTLDTHVKNLRKKIQNKDLILTIRGEWYRLNK